jgi:hypothetical protein
MPTISNPAGHTGGCQCPTRLRIVAGLLLNLSLDYDVTAAKLPFTPYTSAEVFDHGAKGSWN